MNAQVPAAQAVPADVDLERRFGGLRRLYGDLRVRELVACR